MTKTVLQNILQQKDKRELRIKLLAEKFNSSIICFKVNYPGDNKCEDPVPEIFNCGKNIINQFLESSNKIILFKKENMEEYEMEYYWVIEENTSILKQQMINIENNHFLGRLWDIDIYNSKAIPYKRKNLEIAPRKCLICQEEVFFCRRQKKHSLEDLKNFIKNLYKEFKKRS